MSDKDPQSVIDSYRKRQQLMPFLIWGLAALLVTIGIIILVFWLTGSNGPKISLFATSTPTPTNTFTPTPVTPTATPTETATITMTPTLTITMTPSGPQEYTILEQDNCWEIAQKFKVDFEVLLAINNFGNTCPIKPGDKILIPAPNQTLPTETPLPSDIARGTKINYIVRVGDTLAIIAAKFNTTREAIIEDNKIKDANTLFAGQTLIIKVNMVTPTQTLAPTSTNRPTTPTPPVSGTAASATKPPAPSVTPTK
jgi:LysM repeat protein